MLGMGWVEIFVIVVVALLAVGPDKLPEVARGVAKTLRKAQRIMADIRDSINLEELDAQMREDPASRPGPAHPHDRPGSLPGIGSKPVEDDEGYLDPYGDYEEPLGRADAPVRQRKTEMASGSDGSGDGNPDAGRSPAPEKIASS